MNFINLPTEYAEGVKILSKRLGTDKLNVNITFEYSNKPEVGLKAGEGYIKCSLKHHFFRLLALFVQHYDGNEFSISEKPCGIVSFSE